MSITLDSVSYTYVPGTAYSSNALRNISLTVQSGEYVGIMGKTGSGKSTLIQLIAGLLSPTSGTILLDGRNINDKNYNRDELRRRIGVVFQFPEYQLFESTVERDISFGLKHFGWSEEKKKNAVRKSLEMMGFEYEKVRNQSPFGFSGGEKRRIAIAGILAAEPEILILDEPAAGLDPHGRSSFLNLVDRLNAEGVTILMISHNANILTEHAKRIIVLKDGELLKDAPAKNIFSDAEWLRQNGLGIGQVRQCAELLIRKGFPVPEDTIHYDDLLRHMIAIGKEKIS